MATNHGDDQTAAPATVPNAIPGQPLTHSTTSATAVPAVDTWHDPGARYQVADPWNRGRPNSWASSGDTERANTRADRNAQSQSSGSNGADAWADWNMIDGAATEGGDAASGNYFVQPSVGAEAADASRGQQEHQAMYPQAHQQSNWQQSAWWGYDANNTWETIQRTQDDEQWIQQNFPSLA